MTDFQQDSDPELDELREEVERLRMQLSACAVASKCNTYETLSKHWIPRDSPCWSPAYEDVCDAVAREIAHREQYERLLKHVGGG